MIFEICETLRENISDMNDKILDKLKEIEEKNSINSGLSQG